MSTLLRSFVRYGLLAPIAAAMLVAACSRATVENYSKIQAGMTRDQVYEILGQPDEVSGGGIGQLTVSSEVWKGRKQTIQVTFGSDKVALKSIAQRPPE